MEEQLSMFSSGSLEVEFVSCRNLIEGVEGEGYSFLQTGDILETFIIS